MVTLESIFLLLIKQLDYLKKSNQNFFQIIFLNHLYYRLTAKEYYTDLFILFYPSVDSWPKIRFYSFKKQVINSYVG